MFSFLLLYTNLLKSTARVKSMIVEQPVSDSELNLQLPVFAFGFHFTTPLSRLCRIYPTCRYQGRPCYNRCGIQTLSCSKSLRHREDSMSLPSVYPALKLCRDGSCSVLSFVSCVTISKHQLACLIDAHQVDECNGNLLDNKHGTDAYRTVNNDATLPWVVDGPLLGCSQHQGDWYGC